MRTAILHSASASASRMGSPRRSAIIKQRTIGNRGKRRRPQIKEGIMLNDLRNLVERHTNRRLADEYDWGPRREKWLTELKNLYDFVTQELASAGLDESAIERIEADFHEEALGKYSAAVLKLHFSRAAITFEPVASVIIGGYGRVDVWGPGNRLTPARLIAEDARPEKASGPLHPPPEKREWIWNLYLDRSKPRHFVCFDEKSLSALLSACLGETE